ncbi:LemA family protein [Candidatus Marinimicrobia bacterium]|nr:LemA family protein [Candidatus Neomarinimicrobiota bacterium]
MNTVIMFIVVLIVTGLISWLFTVYNGLVQVKENIKKSWANINVLLMQRSDEIPKLVKVLKSFVKHEKIMLDNILKSRNSFLGASSIDEKADADRQISKALKSVFALSEAYPELSSNENFLKLQGRISGLENQISDRRELYNDSVNNYNIRIQSIPDTFVAKALNLAQEEMFEVDKSKIKDHGVNLDNI